MINVLSVKVGTKYNANYVNRLLKMCRRTITDDFNFYCYTDDPSGIDRDVVCIDFIDHNISKPVFNKLYLMSNQLTTQLFHQGDKCIYFDLDVVIKQNIDCLFDPWLDDLRVIHTSWKDNYHIDVGYPHFIHSINTSCMTWSAFHVNDYWQEFIDGKEFFLELYTGMDQYLYFTKRVRGLLPNKFHSFLYGFSAELKPKYRDTDTGIFIIRDDDNPLDLFPVCLFNGKTTIDDYMLYYNKYYADSISSTISCHIP